MGAPKAEVRARVKGGNKGFAGYLVASGTEYSTAQYCSLPSLITVGAQGSLAGLFNANDGESAKPGSTKKS
jgi:hypothetical protein